MKKLIALLLATLMLLSALPVLAEANSIVTLPDYGLTFVYPEAFDNAEYMPMLSDSGVLHRDPYVAVLNVLYYAIPNGGLEARAAQVDSDDPESVDKFYKLWTAIAAVIVTNAESLDTAFGDIGGSVTDNINVTEFAVNEPYHYYYIWSKSYDDYLENISDQVDTDSVRADIGRVNDALLAALREADLSIPVDTCANAIGTSMVFDTTDLDGNAVNTGDLFKDNKITMVNFWGSWCGYCVDEMPELAEIHTRLQEKGCGIVGFEYEKNKPLEAFKDDALYIMQESGTNYPNVFAPKEPPQFISGYPCTVFVDSEGKILTYPISGAQVELYEETVDKLLAGEDMTAAVEPAAHESGNGEYHIIVTDSEGPVKGVAIQFCDETTCSIQMTDENGVATFRPAEPNAYEVHILQAPEGYAENDELYRTEDTWSDLNIVIEKAN